jgi:hypothetical protein
MLIGYHYISFLIVILTPLFLTEVTEEIEELSIGSSTFLLC